MSTPSVIELLGALAYGELAGFERSSADAAVAPTLPDKIRLAATAADEFRHYELLAARLTELGADPLVAMQPFVEVFDTFHDAVTPSDWLEGVMKAYIGDGISADLFGEFAQAVPSDISSLVNEVLNEPGYAEYAVERLQQAISDDPKVAGRLALFGRRLMGEMISQAAGIASVGPELMTLLPVDVEDRVGHLVNRMTVGHTRRMDALGLAS